MSVLSTNPFFDPFVNPFRVLVMSQLKLHVHAAMVKAGG